MHFKYDTVNYPWIRCALRIGIFTPLRGLTGGQLAAVKSRENQANITCTPLKNVRK